MNAETIKTLAEYIARLHQENVNLENPEQYANNETDTNGVAQDQADQTSSEAN
jgi:hypothetical protein